MQGISGAEVWEKVIILGRIEKRKKSKKRAGHKRRSLVRKENQSISRRKIKRIR
jgi:hypothetical protein